MSQTTITGQQLFDSQPIRLKMNQKPKASASRRGPEFTSASRYNGVALVQICILQFAFTLSTLPQIFSQQANFAGKYKTGWKLP